MIQVDDKQFLVGGAANSVSLLAQLDKPADFSNVLQSRIAEVNASGMSTFLHRLLIGISSLLILVGSGDYRRGAGRPNEFDSQWPRWDPCSTVWGSCSLRARNYLAAASDIRISGVGNGASWTIIVLLTFLTLIPSLLLCMTPFARLLIVFHFLRQALGLQTTPTNQTLIGLSLVLTFFLMQPVGDNVYQVSVAPLQSGEITAFQAVERGEAPVREFMLHYVREKDVALFVELSKEPRPASPNDLSMRVVLPAYILSELRTGFQIGTVLFLPFLAIDMIVASISTSVGMLQLPPVVISTPLKLLLFVMVDGWNLLVGSLMRSFQ